MNDKERPDLLSELIRKKLEDHRLPVDADCWDEIEVHFKPKNKSRRIIGWIGSSVAAVAVIILLLLAFPENSSPSDIAQTNTVKDTVKTGTPTVARREEIIKNLPEKNITHTPQEIKHWQVKREPPADKEKEVDENIFIILEDSLHLANVTDIPSSGNNQPDSIAPAYIAEDEKQIEKETIRKRHEEKIILPKKETSGKWLLAASISSSGSLNFATNSEDCYISSIYHSQMPNVSSSDPVPGSSLTLKYGEEEHTDMDHSLPLSFGINIRKNINEHIGIETGVVYTYLSSKFKKSTKPDYRAKQELHYLGVPLNLVVYLLNDSRWNIYVSGGGMVEKGLRYKYTENASKSSNYLSDINEKGTVDGVQWSVSGAIGVSYLLANDWGVYFEPKVSHYFDNDQPASIRTDKNTVFGLSGGLRYEF